MGATLLEPPPLPPDAPGELEEEQPARRATSRTKPSPRGSISLCNQVRGRRAVTYRSMVTPLKPLGSRCAFALSNTSSSEPGHLWPIPRGVQKCIAPTSEDRQLESANRQPAKVGGAMGLAINKVDTSTAWFQNVEIRGTATWNHASGNSRSAVEWSFAWVGSTRSWR